MWGPGVRRQVGPDSEPRRAHRSRCANAAPLAERARISSQARCTERRPLCETVGYARRAAANSRLAPPEGKVERGYAAQWCGRARRLCTPRDCEVPPVSCQCRF